VSPTKGERGKKKLIIKKAFAILERFLENLKASNDQ
jgi:hypothetical protein